MTGPRIKGAIVMDANWHHKATCWPDYTLFDSHDPDDIAEAKRICNTCPVKAECLENAIQEESQPGASRHGVRGGLSEEERAKKPRRTPAPKPIQHGTNRGHDAHTRRGEKPCDPCRIAKNAYEREKRAKRKASA